MSLSYFVGQVNNAILHAALRQTIAEQQNRKLIPSIALPYFSQLSASNEWRQDEIADETKFEVVCTVS